MRTVAFLRGINVGGRHMVKMAELQSIVESIGATEVTTYLQSGNVLFEAPTHGPALDRSLETHLSRQLGFEVPVVTRTAAAMSKIAHSHPLASSPGAERSLFVVFLAEEPSADAARTFSVPERCADRLHLDRREVYLDLEHAGRIRLTLAWLERQLGVRGTQRNWRTTRTIAELLAD